MAQRPHYDYAVTNDSVEALGLSKGQPATAVFKAGAVILAVAG